MAKHKVLKTKELGSDIVSQSIGIDIGKDLFFVNYRVKHSDSRQLDKGSKSFNNNGSGYVVFLKWCNARNKTPDIKPVYVMEATGVYYENLAYFLHSKDQLVSVQLAQKLKYFAKSRNIKTKTDKADSKMISEFGVTNSFTGIDLWAPPSKNFILLRNLTRKRKQLYEYKISMGNQLHAQQHSYIVDKEINNITKSLLKTVKKHIKRVEKSMRKHVASDKLLKAKVANVEKVLGLGFLTIVTIISETNGFALFSSSRQLVSYAGLDVVENSSGNTAGKARISKKGNAILRAALYAPAMTAARYNKPLKVVYDRVNNGHSSKMPGHIAVMRKLLVLAYTLWKKNEPYDENYARTSSLEEPKEEVCVDNKLGQTVHSPVLKEDVCADSELAQTVHSPVLKEDVCADSELAQTVHSPVLKEDVRADSELAQTVHSPVPKEDVCADSELAQTVHSPVLKEDVRADSELAQTVHSPVPKEDVRTDSKHEQTVFSQKLNGQSSAKNSISQDVLPVKTKEEIRDIARAELIASQDKVCNEENFVASS